MYSTSHFHSTSHEVLAICNGEAKLCFGHEDNPGRVEETLRQGDVVVVPAGEVARGRMNVLMFNPDVGLTMTSLRVIVVWM
jgi:uncharacterized protein YjlB